jgi:hypothetical protein
MCKRGPVPEAQTALVALIPEADPVVGRYRSQLDSGAQVGVPAHVTILYPFLPPGMVTDTIVAELDRLLGGHTAFDVSFDSVAWFDDQVAYLRPTPDEPFRLLTASAWRRWPACPPYGGAHSEPTPHLTIGDGGRSPDLEAAATAIARSLPIRSRVSDVHLMTGTDQPASWTEHSAFTLGRPGGPDR